MFRAELVEYSCQAPARQGRVHLDRAALPREIVNDVQGSKDPAVGELVRHEVQRPALVRSRGQRQGYASSGGNPLAQAPSHHQTFQAVQPVYALVVDLVAFPPEQDVQSTVAVPRPLSRQSKHPLTKALDACPP